MAPLQFAPQRLQQGRLAAGLTLEELASLTGFSVFTVHAWETGRNVPLKAHLSVMAEALGCSPVDLLTGQPTTEPARKFGGRQADQATPLSGPVRREPEEGNRDQPSYAEAEINYRDIHGRLRVPANHTHQLLDAVIAGLCIAGMVGGPVGLLAWGGASLPPGALLALCAVHLVAFGVLTGVVVCRRR